MTTQSVEVAETIAPVIFLRKELRESSGGAGRHRGELGQVIEIGGANGYPISNFSMFDRVEHAALGRAGGCEGALGKVSLKAGAKVSPKGKVVIPSGDRLALRRLPRALGKTIASSSSAISRSQTRKTSAVVLVNGVERSYRPLPRTRTCAPEPRHTAPRHSPVISDRRNPVCTAKSMSAWSRRPLMVCRGQVFSDTLMRGYR